LAAGGDRAVEPPANAYESLRDAIVASLKGNPEIQISLAQQDDARYAVDAARAAYLPHLDLSVGYGREFAKAGTATETWRNRMEGSITLAQTVWDFGVTTNDISRARASYRSAQWATREKIESISYDITSAYVGVLRAEELVDLARQEIDADKRVLRMVTVQKDLGLTTPADVSRAQAQLDGAQSQLLDRQSALQQSRLNYRRLTGHLPAHALALSPAAAELPANVQDAVDLIDGRSPRMAQAVEDRRSLEKQYASQSGTFLPRISVMVQGNHKYDVMGKTGMADDARAMVQVSYNLLNGGADRATRHRIAARMREADYELDRRRREVEQDIRTDFTALDAARAKIATIDAEIESAQRVVDLYRQQFREGKRTVFEVLDSEKTLYGAKGNQVVNRAAMNLAEYRVLQKLGGLFDLVSSHEPLPPLVSPAPVK
jgi:TolC family type I secretion outer membrane protein